MDELIELPLALGGDGNWRGIIPREHRLAKILLSEVVVVGVPIWGTADKATPHHFTVVLKTSGTLLRVEVPSNLRMSYEQDFEQLCAIRQTLLDRVNGLAAKRA